MSEKNCCCAFFSPFYVEAWELWNNHKFEAAEKAARDLLAQPCLGIDHKAGLNLLLAACPGKHVDHAEKAIALYTNMIDYPGLTDAQSAELRDMLAKAKAFGEIARQDHQAPPCEVYARMYMKEEHTHTPGSRTGSISDSVGAQTVAKEEVKREENASGNDEA